MSNATQSVFAAAFGGAITLAFVEYMPEVNPLLFVIGLVTAAVVFGVIDVMKKALS